MRTRALVLGVTLVFASSGVGLQAPSSPQQSGKGDIGVQVRPADPPQEKKITPEEAHALFASIDETLAWLSKDTGFPIKNKVKGELASREQVARYVESHLAEDEDAKRFERSEVVLKKFGLLPRSFDLHSFLVQLLKEQVAGYYDVKTKRMYLLDWLTPESQRPVLAHELTHALQDQSFDLKNWETPKTKKGSDKEQFSYDEDEASTARSAVAEGQGMVTLVDYMLRDSGHSVADSPQVAAMMRAAMTSSNDFPLLKTAPLMIRESLVFPYGDGLTFETSLLLRSGKDAAFSGAFRRPPEDTHAVIDVGAYLESAPAQWLVIPDLRKEIGPQYEKYDEGSIGQLDTRILVEQYADHEVAKRMAEAWRGGAYFAAGNKDGKASGTANIGLVYLSRWNSELAADDFADIYAEYLPKRYGHVEKVAKQEALCAQSSCRGSYFFNTSEGPVSIVRVDGFGVVIAEGFPNEIATKVTEKVALANPAQSITTRYHSLSSPLRTSALIREAIASRVAARFGELLQNR